MSMQCTLEDPNSNFFDGIPKITEKTNLMHSGAAEPRFVMSNLLTQMWQIYLVQLLRYDLSHINQHIRNFNVLIANCFQVITITWSHK